MFASQNQFAAVRLNFVLFSPQCHIYHQFKQLVRFDRLFYDLSCISGSIIFVINTFRISNSPLFLKSQFSAHSFSPPQKCSTVSLFRCLVMMKTYLLCIILCGRLHLHYVSDTVRLRLVSKYTRIITTYKFNICDSLAFVQPIDI